MSEHQSFNLLDEPWIEVLSVDSTPSTVSIRQLLENADRYQRLAASLETVNFAILRVLLAILYRSWDSPVLRNKMRALRHWQQKWDEETVFDDDVQEYLTEVHDRFDLRHPERPFLQVADLHTSKNEWKSLDIFIPDSGEVGDLFTMRTDIESLSPAQAAQFLIHANAYDYSGIKSGAVGDSRVKGGRGYPLGIGWAGWLGGTILEGHNLRETLLLNYVPAREQAGSEFDVPVWELEEQLTSGARSGYETTAENAAAGPVELLTWPQRRLRLRWDGDRVTAVLITNGDAIGYTIQDSIETMTPWRFSDPQSTKAKAIRYMPATLQPGRAVWRSLPNLLPNQDFAKAKSKYADGAPTSKPALNVEWVGTLSAQGYLEPSFPIRLRMVSMLYGAKSSSYADVLADSLHVSAFLLSPEGETLRSIARVAIRRTEEVDYALRQFNNNIAFAVSGDGAVDSDEVQRAFYFSIDLPFREWIADLSRAENPDELLADWNQRLRSTAKEKAEQILASQPPSVWAGRVRESTRITGPVAMNRLDGSLKKILGSPSNEKEGAHSEPDDI
ncbi:type I-E CRISPR-associated protein Cse1/CasA [Corynebacterium pacaense]|uniref:type I-E CRISPR-associated protein Cse1/CasA n=1 Tax=Corynebacterium pacaense TaxID=1816684 RepID=UPI0009BB6721|nr:type I-E CRISPR-associated protein Cse1/CasA [Corynebacterium pacaense]